MLNVGLPSDGDNHCAYDNVSRLIKVSVKSSTSNNRYTGLRDRIGQTVDDVTTSYPHDQAAGLTQVLDDGTNTYLYGLGRIGEQQPGGWRYHHGDALGSVR